MGTPYVEILHAATGKGFWAKKSLGLKAKNAPDPTKGVQRMRRDEKNPLKNFEWSGLFAPAQARHNKRNLLSSRKTESSSEFDMVPEFNYFFARPDVPQHTAFLVV
jgi:hypothetical protein